VTWVMRNQIPLIYVFVHLDVRVRMRLIGIFINLVVIAMSMASIRVLLISTYITIYQVFGFKYNQLKGGYDIHEFQCGPHGRQ